MSADSNFLHGELRARIEPLWERARAGEEFAYERLFEAIRPWTTVVSRRCLAAHPIARREGNADDFAQEALLRLWSRIQQGGVTATRWDQLAGYLTKIIHSCIAHAVRKSRTDRRNACHTVSLQTLGQDPSGSDPTPEEAVEVKEIVEEYSRQLDRRTRQVLELRRLGLTWRQTAGVIGRHEVTLRRLLHRAITRFRKRLASGPPGSCSAVRTPAGTAAGGRVLGLGHKQTYAWEVEDVDESALGSSARSAEQGERQMWEFPPALVQKLGREELLFLRLWRLGFTWGQIVTIFGFFADLDDSFLALLEHSERSAGTISEGTGSSGDVSNADEQVEWPTWLLSAPVHAPRPRGQPVPAGASLPRWASEPCSGRPERPAENTVALSG